MTISLPRLLLPLLLALAFVVRWEPTRTIRLLPDERAGGQGEWLIDDPRTCEHLRRVELAIATDKVVVRDSFLNHPSGGEIPALPFLDTLVAGIAQRFLRSPDGEVALSFVDEARLESLAVQLPPFLGLLAVVAAYAAARQLTSGPRRDVAALLAAAMVALHPATIGVSAAGVLDGALLGCVLYGFLLRSIVRSLTSDQMPTSLLDALVAGALAGLLVAGTVVGPLVYATVWAALVVRAWRASGESRANALRSGLFFCLVAAFLARLPLSEGPWEESAGLVRGWLAGTSLLVFVSSAPFVVMFLRQGTRPSLFRTACFAAALIAMAWQIPTLAGDLGPALRAWRDHGATWRVAHESFVGEWERLATLVLLPMIVLASAATAWQRRGDVVTSLLGTGAIALVACAFVTPLAWPYAVVAVACWTARFVDELFAAQDSVLAWKPRALSVVLAGVLLAFGFAPYVRGVDRALREERIDFVATLRWMRTGTESGSAWNAPHARGGWGVLAHVSDGPLVAYHARRPVVASPWGLFGGDRGLRAAREALERDPARFARFLRGQEIHYVLVAGRLDRARLDGRLVPDLETPSEIGARRALRVACSAVPPLDVPEFRLVRSTSRRVGPDGRAPTTPEAGMPVLSIFEVERLVSPSSAPGVGPSFSPR